MTATLPPETTRKFFLGWTFEDLRYVLQLSTRWRAIAMDDPLYWHDIALRKDSLRALRQMQQRLDAAGERPFCITVELLNPLGEINVTVLSVLPALLSAKLAQIQRLKLELHSDYAPVFLSALSKSAPLLVACRIGVLLDSEIQVWNSIPLPDSLFDGDAPCLVEMGLRNIDISKSQSPLLSRIQTLAFGGGSAWHIPFVAIPNVFTHFPSLTCVHFTGGALLTEKGYREPGPWRSLKELWLSVYDKSAFHALETLPLSGVEQIWTVDGKPRAIGKPAKFMYATSRLGVRGRLRRYETAGVQSYRSHDLLRRTSFPDMVTALTISTDLWERIAPILLPFPYVRTLTVVMHYALGRLNRLPSVGRVIVSGLKTLRIHATYNGAILASSDVVEFCNNLLGDVRLPVRLVLENVSMSGDEPASHDAVYCACSVTIR
ncbi:hypothetical protein EXIGLDRAFT_752670 [Exidia glandulosa HHB12029]|uniref:F-box domain-containing protein n=1 Tax=Exidia glandulosa HHB12029 TaxID=1314781 RepID=A0A165EDD5_EXIGL|nr:hypothetical protein EXIGLDRAFT_752670 [Exidia glandulosa HHB12029]